MDLRAAAAAAAAVTAWWRRKSLRLPIVRRLPVVMAVTAEMVEIAHLVHLQTSRAVPETEETVALLFGIKFPEGHQ